MTKRVVIIGAVALGPKVACRLRRLDPSAEITLIDRDNLISYGGCGIPYYLGGDISDLEQLYSTSAHILRDGHFFSNCKGIDLRTEVEAIAINRQERTVMVRDGRSGDTSSLVYDKLVLATGGTPLLPPIAGAELDNVFTLSSLHEAEKIKSLMTTGKVGRAVIIGGGAIGIEVAEAMADLWQIDTTLIEMENQILPTLFGKCIVRVVESHLRQQGVKLLTDTKVNRIRENIGVHPLTVETSQTDIPADIVIMATGVRPNTALARKAGLALGSSGGILVDRRMRTSDPHIYAGGDCVELRNLVSGENVLMPLGSLANRQGRVIATNIAGGNSHFDGTVGTFCIKAFDLGAAKAGLTYRQAKEAGFDPVYAVVSQADHAHFYPQSEMLYISLLADRRTRKILGIEAAGRRGEAVKSRVDSVAVLLKHGVTIDDICNMESGYAPPYASAMDVINNAGNALDNILAGLNTPIDVNDFLDRFHSDGSRILDTRGEKEAAPFVEKYGSRWINIPQEQLRQRVAEIPRQETLYLICDTGPRSYEAQVVLAAGNIRNTLNIQGGYALIKMTDPDFL